jgi:hypothetical protein
LVSHSGQRTMIPPLPFDSIFDDPLDTLANI